MARAWIGKREAFARMRLGIGSPPDGIDWSEFVLMPFLEEEREAAGGLIESGADALEMIMEEGLDRAMNRFNRLPAE